MNMVKKHSKIDIIKQHLRIVDMPINPAFGFGKAMVDGGTIGVKYPLCDEPFDRPFNFFRFVVFGSCSSLSESESLKHCGKGA